MINKLSDIPIISFVVVLALGFWGGFLSFNRRIAVAELKQEPIGKKRLIVNFFIDSISSMGIAIISYMGMVGYGSNEILAIAIAGLMAHQGTRAIYLIELTIAEKLNLKTLQEELKQKNQKEK